LYGDPDWRKGGWQGYQYADFKCVIDLKKITRLAGVDISCLQDTRAWIIFPSEFEVFISSDNISYRSIANVKNQIDPRDYTVQKKVFSVKSPVPLQGRYVKIEAKNFGTLPVWHEGKGDGAFIFVDEIEVK
jgi:hypothetical protein